MKKILVARRMVPIILTIIGVVFLTGCENKQADENSLKQIQFNIDTNTLGEEVSDSGKKISFKPPKEWKQINPKLFNEFLEKASLQLSDDEPVNFNYLYIFKDDSLKCLLNVSELQFRDKNKPNDAELAEYDKALFKKFGKEKLKRAEFLKEDLPVIQYMLNDKGKVNFKILFYNKAKKLFQFDYVASFDIYPKEIKAIESSIGSIKLLK
ncbi:MAG: hypothetical protein C4539_14380 [Ignavibacteriales bacterium]|nr:MAG: hypothetical protein C4539_14380 [Ignavibacteriales bacterium]